MCLILSYHLPMLSIIIPTFNEMNNGYLNKIFPQLSQIDGIEVIIIDSMSSDGTYEYAKSFPFKTYQIETTSRAKRLNHGMQLASGEMFLLHHPRSLLEMKGVKYLRDHIEEYYWGGFTHKFDLNHPLLRFTSWYSNRIRADRRNIFYLDHCIFVRKFLIQEIGYLPEVDIFEDTELSKMLNKKCEGLRLESFALTSAIRFEKNGILKHALNNQILKWKYYLKVDHKKMNKAYENKVALNAEYRNSEHKSTID